MKVKLKSDFPFSPNGYDIINYKKGDIVEGKAAEKALANNLGDKVAEPKQSEPKTKKPVTAKTKKPAKPKETK